MREDGDYAGGQGLCLFLYNESDMVAMGDTPSIIFKVFGIVMFLYDTALEVLANMLHILVALIRTYNASMPPCSCPKSLGIVITNNSCIYVHQQCSYNRILVALQRQ